MAEFEDSVFSNEEDAILLNMVRAYNIKNIKNRFELSQVWDNLTDAYNKTTTQNYTKKQLQKRTSNIDYKLKKLEEKHKNNSSSVSSKNTDLKSTSAAAGVENHENNIISSNLDNQKLRVEIAKEMAEIKRAKAEDLRLQKEQILLEVAKAKLIEAENRAELVALELKEKRKQMML